MTTTPFYSTELPTIVDARKNWLHFLSSAARQMLAAVMPAKPREEERIFVFLDLNKSTELAEQLGHLRYSQLLRDCFADLAPLMRKYRGEVYQYVGDEVILSWQAGQRWMPAGAVSLFFEFENRLQERGSHYVETYGVLPSFKASIHGGKVVVARLGRLRQHKVYHGDVLNACARMLEVARQIGSRLVVSEPVAESLQVSDPFIVRWRGHVSLRGKSGLHHLFSVSPY